MKRSVFVIGLTGSIGMGKSTAAAMLRRRGLPIFDADATVHRLMGPGGSAVQAVETAFPGVVRDGAVDRAELGKRVFGDGAKLKQLERILHPRVGAAERAFLARVARQRLPMAVRDVPLLFETGGERRCDATVVVSAPAHIQAARVLARPGMTRERLAQIRAKQLPDAEKRRRADFVVPTGLGRRVTWDALGRILQALRGHGVAVDTDRIGDDWRNGGPGDA
jgi:dephospho-CoA kinase